MSTAAPPQATNPFPFLASLGLAVAGFFVVVNATNILGYGKDTHTLRVVALTLPLFIGGVVAFWPGRSSRSRAGVLVVPVGVAVAAWVFTPCSSGGISLAQAAAKSNEVKATIATPPTYEDVAKSEEIGKALASIAEFPSLIASLQPAVNEWGNAAAERLAERYRSIRPDDIPGLDDTASKAQLLTKYITQTREPVATAERAFSNRSADFWASELNRVTHGDFIAFRKWGAKRDAMKSILPNPEPIVAAESEWVSSTVEAVITRSEQIQLFMPQRARDTMLSTAMDIRNLPGSGNMEAIPFRAARQKLFTVALTRAQADARTHVEQSAFDRAFGLARSHAVDWSPDAFALGPEAIESLMGFRDGYRYLATLAEKAGTGPEIVPPPRSRP